MKDAAEDLKNVIELQLFNMNLKIFLKSAYSIVILN